MPLPSQNGFVPDSPVSKKVSTFIEGFQFKVDPLVDVQMDIFAIEGSGSLFLFFGKRECSNWFDTFAAIGLLLNMSLKEDFIGIVQSQNSLTTVLNSMVGCLLAIEDYVHYPLPLSFASRLSSAPNQLEGNQIVRQRPLALANGLSLFLCCCCVVLRLKLWHFLFSVAQPFPTPFMQLSLRTIPI
jgi:hypothetical protein